MTLTLEDILFYLSLIKCILAWWGLSGEKTYFKTIRSMQMAIYYLILAMLIVLLDIRRNI